MITVKPNTCLTTFEYANIVNAEVVRVKYFSVTRLFVRKPQKEVVECFNCGGNSEGIVFEKDENKIGVCTECGYVNGLVLNG